MLPELGMYFVTLQILGLLPAIHKQIYRLLIVCDETKSMEYPNNVQNLPLTQLPIYEELVPIAYTEKHFVNSLYSRRR